MKHERLLIAGILISGIVALFAKSAGAATPESGLLFDPGLGVPRRQTQTRFQSRSLSKPIDVYEWGDPISPGARVLVASDDSSSFVAFVPASSGDVQTILGKGAGQMTEELLRFVKGQTPAT